LDRLSSCARREVAVKRRIGIASLLALGLAALAQADDVTVTRFVENPLVTLSMSSTLGDNANGPTVIRVPSWVEHPLGRYYMYFAHHKGRFIRLAYADSVRGPWKLYEPGVMKVQDTALYRPQPDPADSPPGAYTHVASPEIYVDDAHRRIVLWAHGMWTNGERWPQDKAEAGAWLRQHGYAQFTQTAESSDGLSFHALPAISKQSYLRVFEHDGQLYAMARLGQLLRADDPLAPFELGPNPFRDSPYKDRVRHVAMLEREGVLHIFFTAIRDAPESLLHTTMKTDGDWSAWKIGEVETVLEPAAPYECAGMPVEQSAVGEIDHAARQIRDPDVLVDGDATYLFYTFCGEQGVAGAEVHFGQ
jgi:hypothetical protein